MSEILKNKLNPIQYRRLEILVEKSELEITWRLLERYIRFNDYWIYWETSLNLEETGTTDLWDIKEVWLNLLLEWCTITSFGLRKVWRCLNLEGTEIKSLENLKEVWEDLFLKWSLLEDLWNLERIWRSLDLRWCKLQNLWNLKIIWWTLDLRWCKLQNLWNLKKVWTEILLYKNQTELIEEAEKRGFKTYLV